MAAKNQNTVVSATQKVEPGAKKDALATALAQIEKQFGKGAVMKLGDNTAMQVDAISTGSLGLDMALGVGGVPRGRIIEVYGPESSGKTTLALHILAEAQKQGGEVAFIDVEHALDPVYARALGVDIDNLLVSQPDSGEQALEIAEALVRSGAIDVLIVDSVAAMTTKAEIEGEMGDSHVGMLARLMSQAMRKLTSIISKSNCVAIFINQIREKIGVVYGNPETTPGGRALKFYASVRMEVRKGEAIKDGTTIIGNRTRVKIVKNKVAPPFRECEFDILYGKGISRSGEVLDLAVDLDIINKSGSWFSYEGQRLGQGRDNIKELLQNTPQLMQEVEEKIKKKLAEQKAAAVKAAEQKRNGRKPAESNNALEQAAEQAAAAQMQQANLNALDMDSAYGNDRNPLIEKSEFILSLFEQLVGAGNLSAKEKSILDRCTADVYRDYIRSGYTGEVPTLKDMYRQLMLQPEEEARGLALSSELFINGSLNTFAQPTNVNKKNRIMDYDIRELGEQLMPLGMLVTLDSIFNRVIQNWKEGKTTWIFADEFYLLFRYEYSANFFYRLYKRIRKYNGFVTGLTQNVEELLKSDTARLMLANSEFLILLNQASTDREELAALLNISENQLSYITNVSVGSGLIRCSGNIVPFENTFPKNTDLYKLMTTKPGES